MTLTNPADDLERQNAKLRRIAEALMNRVEQSPDHSGIAYAQFERAALLEAEVRQRTRELERTLDLLQTSNRRLAEAMSEAEAARSNLAQAIETVEEGFALFDAGDRLVLSNSRFCRELSDVAAVLKPGLPFAEYVARVAASRHLSLPEGESSEEWRDRRMRRHDDRRTTFNVSLSLDRWIQVSEHRTQAGGTVILQTDVTQIVRRERRARERLIHRQARMTRATLDHLAQGVCTFDRDGRLMGWNAQMEALLDGPVDGPLVGMPFTDLLDRLGDSFALTGTVDRAELESWALRRSRRPALDFEVAMAGRGTFIVSAQEMPDRGFVVSFTDVTRERAAAGALRDLAETLERRVAARTEELGEALEEARRANASKTRFMAAASHDLLQPLSAAKLFVSALEDRAEDEAMRGIAGKAVASLASVEAIIEGLLDISKLDSGRASLSVEDASLSAVLDSLRLEMTPLAAARGVDLRVVRSGLTVRSDTVFLRRMVQNLITNAIRYGGGGRVLVGVRRSGGTARIEVWDRGPGIAPEDRGLIFQEFRQLGPPGPGRDGLGLGLAIVERACAMLGHDLALRSEVGRGSCFSIAAPVVEGAGLGTTGQGIAPPRPDLGGMVVFLIEDDAAVAAAVEVMIESWGGEVIHAPSGATALPLLEELGIVPDAFLVDYQLGGGEGPGEDGLQVIATLRAELGAVPVRLVSANRSVELTRRARGARVEILPKPLDREALAAFLAEAGGPRVDTGD